MRIINWIKQHKLVSLLALIIIYLLYTLSGGSLRPLSMVNYQVTDMGYAGDAVYENDTFSQSGLSKARSAIAPVPGNEVAPQAGISDRMVIEESHLSLLVKDVVDTRNKIVSHAKESGGYMVNSSVSNPQDAPTSTVTIRVPSANLESTLTLLRGFSIKVVSENLKGTDVTDQYVDVEKRIAILEGTKARFESILSETREVSDIINLNQQIISIQSQIDSLKGQQEALQKNADLAKLTIFLSTDEIALPYAPSETFRPSVIFKQAVRSLVGVLRDLATAGIWIGVYSVIVIPVALFGWIIYKRRRVISGDRQ